MAENSRLGLLVYGRFKVGKTLPQENYGTCERNVQLIIDESFAERNILANDSVRLLDRIVEEMDLSVLMRAYDSHSRPPAIPPRTMLKVVTVCSDGAQLFIKEEL